VKRDTGSNQRRDLRDSGKLGFAQGAASLRVMAPDYDLVAGPLLRPFHGSTLRRFSLCAHNYVRM
jgi:hypothetical protein